MSQGRLTALRLVAAGAAVTLCLLPSGAFELAADPLRLNDWWEQHGTAAYLSEPFAIGEETFGAALAGAEAMRARVRAGDVWEETTAKIVASSLRVAAMHFAVDGEVTWDLPIGAAVQVEITYQNPPGADHARWGRVKVTTPRHPSGLTRAPAVLLKIERAGNDPKRFRSQPFTLVGPGKPA